MSQQPNQSTDSGLLTACLVIFHCAEEEEVRGSLGLHLRGSHDIYKMLKKIKPRAVFISPPRALTKGSGRPEQESQRERQSLPGSHGAQELCLCSDPQGPTSDNPSGETNEHGSADLKAAGQQAEPPKKSGWVWKCHLLCSLGLPKPSSQL